MLRKISVRCPSRCHSLRKYMGILSLSSSNWIKTAKVVQFLFSSSFLKPQGVQSSILRSFYDDGFFGNSTYIDNSYISMFSFYFTCFRFTSAFTGHILQHTGKAGLWILGRLDFGCLVSRRMDAQTLGTWTPGIWTPEIWTLGPRKFFIF